MTKEFSMEKNNNKNKKILMVVTNASKLDDLNKTGVWLEEFAVPYYRFVEEGYEVTVASPLGGVAPIDESSLLCENPTEWDYTKKYLDNTEKLSNVDYKSYDAIFLPGGHGPLMDLANDDLLGEIVAYFYDEHKPVGAVCHGPAGLLKARTPNGEPIVKGMRLTSFTNEEEKLAGKEKIVPFMLETQLKKLGADFEEGLPLQEHIVVDENLVTGQNPKSSKMIADAFVKKLER